MNDRTLTIFRSTDDRDYDRYILAPPGMGTADAQQLADKTVAQVKAQSNDWETDGWQWDDFEEALVKLGFEPLSWTHCDEEI